MGSFQAGRGKNEIKQSMQAIIDGNDDAIPLMSVVN